MSQEIRPGRRFGLPYGKRLHHRHEFLRFFGKSQVFRLSECTVFRVRNDRGHFRLGITLKARGSSIDRNRVKRQIRESFRKLAPILGGYDYNVVVPATKRLEMPYARRLGQSIQGELPDAIRRRET